MISAGSILLQNGVPHPDCFHLQADVHPNQWTSVKHGLSPHDFEQKLATAGWTFFFMATPISRRAFGFNRAQTTDTALKGLMADARLSKCNCLQIDAVTNGSFLGIPYVSVSAHPRHIQQGMQFSGR